ncbi:hypothetical protein MD484_g8273, partial [Candolleomyces efflorescens]
MHRKGSSRSPVQAATISRREVEMMVGDSADHLQLEIQKRDEKVESLEERQKGCERKISKISRDEDITSKHLTRVETSLSEKIEDIDKTARNSQVTARAASATANKSYDEALLATTSLAEVRGKLQQLEKEITFLKLNPHKRPIAVSIPLSFVERTERRSDYTRGRRPKLSTGTPNSTPRDEFTRESAEGLQDPAETLLGNNNDRANLKEEGHDADEIFTEYRDQSTSEPDVLEELLNSPCGSEVCSESAGCAISSESGLRSLFDEISQADALSFPNKGHEGGQMSTEVFRNPPSVKHASIRPSKLDEASIDDICTLDGNAPANSSIIGYCGILDRTSVHARLFANHRNVAVRLQAEIIARKVEEERAILRNLLLKEWRRQRTASQEVNFLDTSKYFNRSLRLLPASILAVYILVGTLHLLSDLSLADCSFLLRSLRLVLGIVLATSTSIYATSLTESIFVDTRSVLKILQVQPQHQAYLVCPRCSKLHQFFPDDPESDPPMICNKKELGVRCGATLLKSRKSSNDPGRRIPEPIREYRHQPFNDYLARLFSRPELQDHLDQDPRKGGKGTGTGDHWDIWDAPCLKEFKGPDGKTFVGTKDETRLVFSINMDGFNPYGNREAGKKVTLTAIYLVCLNLPPSIRHKMENIYLAGIIPGPQAPSDYEINYFLSPLVDDMVELWNKGVYLSQTAKHRSGRRVRVAIGPLVCDLPASRQMSGFAHYRASRFCSECDLTIDKIDDLTPRWAPRTWKSHLAAAIRWKEAKTAEEREAIVKVDGVRWSELLRLPYWDPTKFTIIDSMHAFYLRIFQHHCRSIWGMNVNLEDGDGPTFDRAGKPPPEEQMALGYQVLRHGHQSKLLDLPRNVLRELCRQASIPFRRNKAVLIQQLVEYRIQQRWFNEDGVHLGDPESAEAVDHPFVQQRMYSSEVLPDDKAVEHYWLTASKTKLRSLNKPDLLIMVQCKVLPRPCLTEEKAAALTVPELRRILEARRHEVGITDAEGRLLAAPSKKTRVLGKKTLAEIRKDMARLQLPSWVARAPSHPGEKKWGKFTADQWRTYCMQILPVTLIRLWGKKPADSTEYRRLDNFMHLVSAVKLATMHKVSEDQIVEYEFHIRHTSRFILGVIYAYLAPFTPGDAFLLKDSIMFCSNSPQMKDLNLKALYHRDELPKKLHEMIQLYNNNYESDVRGTRLSDVFAEDNKFGVVESDVPWVASDFTPLKDEDFDLLQRWMTVHQPTDTSYSRLVALRPDIYRYGQRFTDRNRSVEDSHVIFHDGVEEAWQVGSILGIFSRASEGGPTEQTWAIIQTYEELSPKDTLKDHYRLYPVLGTCLFKNTWGRSPVLVDVRNIRCHVASCVLEVEGIDGYCRLILPLNKVGVLSSSLIFH